MRWEGQYKSKAMKRLRKAWKAGMPDKKAAQYAGMTYEELKDILRMDSRVALTRAGLLAKGLEVEINARTNVVKDIGEGSVDSSWKWLERKVPEEFSTKGTISVQSDDFLSIDEKKAELEKMMEKFGADA